MEKHARKFIVVLDKNLYHKEKTVELISKLYLRFDDEILLITVQDSGLGTNWFKKHGGKQNCSDKCRMRGVGEESVLHSSGGETSQTSVYKKKNVICKHSLQIVQKK